MYCDILILLLQISVFATCAKVDGLDLPTNGVCILWEWEWTDDMDLGIQSNTNMNVQTDESASVSESNMSSEDFETEDTSITTHTVTFKCIGATKSPTSQAVLQQICELSKDGHIVPVNIFCEPENPIDSEAIAFRAHVSNKWQTIGYVVREALPHVHDAIRKKVIQDVRFSWVKYLVSWTHSGPGYYAGIDITILERWPKDVVCCASTR